MLWGCRLTRRRLETSVASGALGQSLHAGKVQSLPEPQPALIGGRGSSASPYPSPPVLRSSLSPRPNTGTNTGDPGDRGVRDNRDDAPTPSHDDQSGRSRKRRRRQGRGCVWRRRQLKDAQYKLTKMVRDHLIRQSVGRPYSVCPRNTPVH